MTRGIHPKELWRYNEPALKVNISMIGQCDEEYSLESSGMQEVHKHGRDLFYMLLSWS